MNPSELGSKSYFSLKKNDLLGLGSCSRIFFFTLPGLSVQLLSKETIPNVNCRSGKKNELPINY